MVNYSKGLIYKLCCNDPTVTDIYVGSTTNFSRRKAEHKYSCNSELSEKYNRYVYRFIRQNGSWDNWSMVLVREYKTTSKQKLQRKERKYIIKLGGTLNVTIPLRTRDEYYKDNNKNIKEKAKDYYYNNQQAVKKKLKENYNKNKVIRLEKRKQNYIAKKQYLSEKVECECGCTLSRQHIQRHKASEKHTRLMNEL